MLNKKIKGFYFLLLIFLTLSFIAPKPAQAITQEKRRLLIQQVEILRHEIKVLQSLLINSRLQQQIAAGSYLAVDLSDNSIILSKNQNQPYPIASITKLMNAVIVKENIQEDKKITLIEKMLRPRGESPSLFAGLTTSWQNLLKASLIQSTNDASEALAYSLGKDKFLNLMNQKAKDLNMENTVFFDAHGLSPSNRSTASDLANLISYIYQNHPEILQITKENNFWLPDSSGWLLKFQNVNNFYPIGQFIGGKTGYLPQAKQTIASVFKIDQKPIAIIVLYSNNRQADIFNIISQIKK